MVGIVSCENYVWLKNRNRRERHRRRGWLLGRTAFCLTLVRRLFVGLVYPPSFTFSLHPVRVSRDGRTRLHMTMIRKEDVK